ncbi:MAG: hypothetical protein DI629_09540 [Mesorhizobium amorphae]|nr:MAG: hypothetical protein DI629_09540 [Mesorhizobium amorphae]
MDWVETVCPVSEEPALRRAEGADVEEFKCPICRKFRISAEALEGIKRYDREGRMELLHLAQGLAGPDEVPLIDKVP